MAEERATVEFGRRVKAVRERREWSQQKLGEVAGLHKSFIGQVERGKKGITLRRILQLSRALGVDAGYMLRGLGAINDVEDEDS